jgi:signal transduction histidine kinase
MAATIIHDLKNPMTTIKGYASLLGRQDLKPELRQRFSETITRSVDTFVEMTQEILVYARGGGPLQRTRVPVGHFVNDLCDFVERDFEEKGLTLQRQLDYTGPLVMDEAKMRRALYNIASNARDAMEAGGRLTIATRSTNHSIEFRLSDTGPGIPEEIRNNLFEPFVTHGKPAGTGLGLAIVKKTIEDHGGTIAVQSAAGQGATFIIRVPRTGP